MIKYSQCKTIARERGLKVGIDAYASLEQAAEDLLRAAMGLAEFDGVSTIRPDHILRAKVVLAKTMTKAKKKG